MPANPKRTMALVTMSLAAYELRFGARIIPSWDIHCAPAEFNSSFVSRIGALSRSDT